MAQYIPKINLPVEGVEHARWLEKRAVDHEQKIEEILKFLKTLGKSGATVSRPVVASAGGNVPPGGLAEDRLAKLSNRDFDYGWVTNTVGGMKDRRLWFPDIGDTVSLVDDWEGVFYDVQITSPADNAYHAISLPDGFSTERQIRLPFYYLSIYVYDHSVDLLLGNVYPRYWDHPDVPIAGASVVSGGAQVTLPAGYHGQWFVLPDWEGNTSLAIPLVDDFYTSTYGSAITSGGAAPTVVATAAAGTGPVVSVNGTGTAGVVSLTTGTSPTTTGWGELLTFSGWTDVPVLNLYPANQAAAALKHYTSRAVSDVEAHFDLTGLAASTTYLFNYSLLPFSA